MTSEPARVPLPALDVPRRFDLASLPRDLAGYLVGAEVVATVWTVYALLGETVHRADLVRFGVFAVLFAAFQLISPRIERMRMRLADSHEIDMTSVWTFAGVIALPTGLSALLALIIGLAMARLRSKAGSRPHRQVFSLAAVLLSCLTASSVLHDVADHSSLPASVPAGAWQALTVVLCIVLYTTVNTAMVAGAIFLSARPRKVRDLLGTSDDNALELATLCLGGLTALAVAHEPWLTFLVIVPMTVLQRGALVKQLEVAATTDPKTGLLNAVAWRQLAQKELARAERDHTSAAVLIVDMDNFKLVNDNYGHLVGDRVLVAVAQCLTAELREYDSLGRFGGEEFVAVLPDVDAPTARAITDRILQRVRTMEIQPTEGMTEALTGLSASIGVALYPTNGLEVEGLLHVADSALYTAKNAGRDRVEFVH